MRKKIDIKKLSTLCKVSDRTVKNWKKDGCPCVNENGRIFYNADKVFKWLVASNVLEKVAAASKLQASLNRTRGKGNKSTVLEKVKETDLTLYSIRNSVAKLLILSQERMAKKIKKGDLDIAVETNLETRLSEQFRKLSGECEELDKRLGKVMRIEDIDKVIGRATSILKCEFRSLPYAIADRLAGMSDPKQIAEVLLGKVDETLRRCSDNLKGKPG